MSPETSDGRVSRRDLLRRGAGRALQIVGGIGVTGSLADAGFIHYWEDRLANDGNPAEPLLVRQADWVLDQHHKNPIETNFDWQKSPDPTTKLPIDQAQSVKLYEARRKSEVPINHDQISETLMKPGVPSALRGFGISLGTVLAGTLLRRDPYEHHGKSQQGKPTLRPSDPKLA